MAIFRRDDQLDALRRVPLFGGLNKAQLSEVAKLTTQLPAKPGSALTKQGQHAREFVLLLEGEARVERDGAHVGRLGPGDFFGELSLLDGQPRTATITAETPCTLLVVEPRAFSSLLENAPGLDRAIMTALCARLREAQNSASH